MKKEITEKFQGEWILLFNDEIIDHSSNIEEILKLAEQKFPIEKYPEDEIKISKVLQSSPHMIYNKEWKRNNKGYVKNKTFYILSKIK